MNFYDWFVSVGYGSTGSVPPHPPRHPVHTRFQGSGPHDEANTLVFVIAENTKLRTLHPTPIF